MFLDFWLFLRAGGFCVTFHDWLSLIEGMRMGLHGQTLKGFFVLCRTLLVKTESDMDKFEELFYQYFKTSASDALRKELEELLHHPDAIGKVLSSYMDRRGLDVKSAAKLLEMRLAVEEEGSAENLGVADGSAKDSSFTGAGAGPGAGSGVMMQGAGGKSIIHPQGDRRFRDWRTDCTIESRQFQMAFRLLRELSRKLETNEEELDIHGTVAHTCNRGGILDIRMQPPRRNRLKLMVLIDSGGSMRPYEQLCSLLFHSLHKANTFSDLKIYYFHNCLEENLYREPSIDAAQTVKTDWVLKNIAKDYKVIFVGDADMAVHELVGSSYGSWGGAPVDGITWFRRFRERYAHSIWFHPQEKEENLAWMSESFLEIGKVFPMFRLSIDGLKEGMYKLMKGR